MTPTEGSDGGFSRRKFLTRMAVAGFVAPVVVSFGLESSVNAETYSANGYPDYSASSSESEGESESAGSFYSEYWSSGEPNQYFGNQYTGNQFDTSGYGSGQYSPNQFG